ncbi:MAG: hypothetical protein CMO01_27815 [Thalassobius sp.]|nr:hypothetical protein [Thalassovita sp.]
MGLIFYILEFRQWRLIHDWEFSMMQKKREGKPDANIYSRQIVNNTRIKCVRWVDKRGEL